MRRKSAIMSMNRKRPSIGEAKDSYGGGMIRTAYPRKRIEMLVSFKPMVSYKL